MAIKKEKIEVVNELLAQMLGSEPLVEFKEPINEIEAEQNYALAQMYSNRGFRSYLENAINRSIKSAVINSDDMTTLCYNKSRVILLKELLIVAKKSFENLEKIKKISIKHADN